MITCLNSCASRCNQLFPTEIPSQRKIRVVFAELNRFTTAPSAIQGRPDLRSNSGQIKFLEATGCLLERREFEFSGYCVCGYYFAWPAFQSLSAGNSEFVPMSRLAVPASLRCQFGNFVNAAATFLACR